jgi:hypothetical protein
MPAMDSCDNHDLCAAGITYAQGLGVSAGGPGSGAIDGATSGVATGIGPGCSPDGADAVERSIASR